jgi:hypothetical protein
VTARTPQVGDIVRYSHHPHGQQMLVVKPNLLYRTFRLAPLDGSAQFNELPENLTIVREATYTAPEPDPYEVGALYIVKLTAGEPALRRYHGEYQWSDPSDPSGNSRHWSNTYRKVRGPIDLDALPVVSGSDPL